VFGFYKSEVSCLFEFCNIIIACILEVVGTKEALCIENGFCHSWQLCWSQLIMNKNFLCITLIAFAFAIGW